ncbi:hypothetical protein Tco_1205588 [Tanacetum coccineum]
MQLEERQLHSNCMAKFKELKIHLECLQNNNNLKVGRNMIPYEIAFRIFFQEKYKPFRMKMYHNLNQLQWQLESEYLYICDPKSCLDVLRTPFKIFFDSKEVNALDFHNKSWQKDFKDYTRCEPKTYRRNLLQYLDVLDKHIDERVLKYRELWLKEREFQATKEIEKRLKEKEIQHQESLVTKGTTLEACLVTEGSILKACLVTGGIEMDDSLVAKESAYDSVTSSEQLDESRSSMNECSRSGNENRSSDHESTSSGNDADVVSHPKIGSHQNRYPRA